MGRWSEWVGNGPSWAFSGRERWTLTRDDGSGLGHGSAGYFIHVAPALASVCIQSPHAFRDVLMVLRSHFGTASWQASLVSAYHNVRVAAVGVGAWGAGR